MNCSKMVNSGVYGLFLVCFMSIVFLIRKTFSSFVKRFPPLYCHHVSSTSIISVTPLVSRGCLFYGPPGTGKTLVARALANECSQGERKVAFFMRKGADCLSKWVGESERQLRLLFDQVNLSSLNDILFSSLYI